MIKKILIIILMLLGLSACKTENNEYLFGGINDNNNVSGPQPNIRVELASKVKKEQGMQASFELFPGHKGGFEEKWNNNEFGCNPGYGKFTIAMTIKDENQNFIFTDYNIRTLDDFLEKDKYKITHEDIGLIDTSKEIFPISFIETFDFTTIDLERGRIGYWIIYYDDINNKPMSDVYKYGISYGYDYKFVKNDAGVTFELGREHTYFINNA